MGGVGFLSLDFLVILEGKMWSWVLGDGQRTSEVVLES